ncbi:L,D-transpeptidase family protein [Dactylosporangium roseum]|uniref:L,D-transpeptidase family protein n=1 Tax=Dactylosporangium roseum TaxID=47989 RepID=A0ABY5YVR8_9ACTN|nr:Ig-like domain-containing protein [Dactylosporangium roseum]UWZ33846.1 L,D-transpeptidase family protein [Dactylosporangium roseum]
MRRTTGASRRAVLMLGAAAAVTAACTEPERKAPSGAAGSPSPSPSGAPLATGQITTPADAAASVSTATDIAVTVDNATRTDVELLDAAGARVEGHLQPDGTTWRPARQLSYNTRYTVKLTVAGGDGKDVTTTTTFTTMKKPANLAKVSSVVQDKQTVGVAMPLIVSFGVDVIKDQRAAVQRRLFATSNPPQEGVWHWFSGKEVHFRPKEYWQPGTTLSLRAAVGGVSFGGKWVGERDVTVQATVGRKLLMEVDNKTKQLTVTQDGQVVRTCPVSLGKPSSPTASGHLIIMIKNEWEWFDSSTFGVPSESDDGYRMKVYWPQRLTWDGEYFHSAPWSEQHQGKRNVSHGCTNLSEANAKWLWQQTLIGDPVIIRGTEEHVKWGNGWTDWDIDWERYAKGSAV